MANEFDAERTFFYKFTLFSSFSRIFPQITKNFFAGIFCLLTLKRANVL